MLEKNFTELKCEGGCGLYREEGHHSRSRTRVNILQFHIFLHMLTSVKELVGHLSFTLDVSLPDWYDCIHTAHAQVCVTKTLPPKQDSCAESPAQRQVIDSVALQGIAIGEKVFL